MDIIDLLGGAPHGSNAADLEAELRAFCYPLREISFSFLKINFLNHCMASCGGQGDNATVPACYSFFFALGSAVGKKILAAGSADSCYLDIIKLQASFHELRPGYLPEIKIIAARLKGLERGRKFLAMIDKFSATRAQRGTDTGHYVFRV